MDNYLFIIIHYSGFFPDLKKQIKIYTSLFSKPSLSLLNSKELEEAARQYRQNIFWG